MIRIALPAVVVALALCAPAVAQTPPPVIDPVAKVGDAPIAKADFDHWFASASKGSPGASRARLRRDVMEFLIHALWVKQEAKRLKISVRPQRVRKVFRRQKRAAFPNDRQYRRFLRETGAREEDILERVKLDLLQGRIQAWVSRNGRSLGRFIGNFRERYRAKTVCADEYFVDECGNALPL